MTDVTYISIAIKLHSLSSIIFTLENKVKMKSVETFFPMSQLKAFRLTPVEDSTSILSFDT